MGSPRLTQIFQLKKNLTPKEVKSYRAFLIEYQDIFIWEYFNILGWMSF